MYNNTECTDIENCADIRCTDAIDHYCFECESDHGVVLGESAYRNLNDSCERKLFIVIICTQFQYPLSSTLFLVKFFLLSWSLSRWTFNV